MPHLLEPDDGGRFTYKSMWPLTFSEHEPRAQGVKDWSWLPPATGPLHYRKDIISSDGMVKIEPRFDQYWASLLGHIKEPIRKDPFLAEGFYDANWRLIYEAKDQIQLILIGTWNDYHEQTQIEPSHPFPIGAGDYLLDKTRWYWSRLKAGETFERYPEPPRPAQPELAQCRTVDFPEGPDERVPLAAVMYPWYGFDMESGESVGGLGSSHLNTSGPNSSHRRGVTDEPAYGFYSSDDESVIARQLADMEAAGINVILVSWWGSGDSDWDGHEENRESMAMVRATRTLLNYIAENSLPFKVALLVEPYMRNPSAEEMTSAHRQTILNDLWATIYWDYIDQMFYMGGQPLVVAWDPVWLEPDGENRFTVKNWGSLGDPGWKKSDRPADRYLDWNWYPNLDLLETMISEDGMYVVFPRYDEYWLRLGGYVPPDVPANYPPRVDPLLTELAYERAWQVAVDNRDRIELLVVNSWNEHKEHTAIEPTQPGSHVSAGRTLLEKTAHYYQQFLNGEDITPCRGR